MPNASAAFRDGNAVAGVGSLGGQGRHLALTRSKSERGGDIPPKFDDNSRCVLV